MSKDKGNGQDQNYRQIELVFASPMLEALNQAAQQNQRSLHGEILKRLLLTLEQEEISEGIINHFAPQIQAVLAGRTQGVHPLIPLLLNPIRIKYTGTFPQAMLLMLEQIAQEKNLLLDTEISMRLLATLLDYEAFPQPPTDATEKILQDILKPEDRILH